MSVVLLLVRLAVGVPLAVVGASRLSELLRPSRPGQSTPNPRAPSRPGPRLPAWSGPFMPVAQLAGGALLVLGLLTPVAAAILVGMTALEVWRQRYLPGAPVPLDDPERLVVTMAGPVGLLVAFAGAGRVSIDHALGLGDGGVVKGLLSLALGLVAATAVVGGRDRLTDPLGGVTGDE